MNLSKKIEERLSIFNNFYDSIRIINPLNKKIVTKINKSKAVGEESLIPCYSLWKKNDFCKNCISMKAYVYNDTFVKIEHDGSGIILIIATPIEIGDDTYIVEILKDISSNGKMPPMIMNDSILKEEFIDRMNEKAKEASIEKSEEKSERLMKLDNQINELREVLNEVYCSFQSEEVKSKTLIISQYLDELIVEYMKEVSCE
jgi:Spo0E like sporulation regulatory protein.